MIKNSASNSLVRFDSRDLSERGEAYGLEWKEFLKEIQNILRLDVATPWK